MTEHMSREALAHGAPMTIDERACVRAAAFRAARVYPGPVGRALRRELMAWEEFGYRFGGYSRIRELVDHIMDAPVSDSETDDS